MLELFASEYRLIAQNVLAFGLIVGAFLWGGGPERAVAATWLIAFEIASRIRRSLVGEVQLADVDVYLASADLVAGICWIAIALYANRNYTLWIAGLQVLAMSAHVARGIAEAVSPIAYFTMVAAPGWFQLFFLAGGLVAHVRRKRRFGKYRDWRFSRNAAEPAKPKGIDQWIVSIAKRGSNGDPR
uniref:hypothetical protein n=1 Tax=uncultured Altererythrobacter sp. TaxID=500840 RepID=UPI002633AE32|nr:hypothetical protein [uncultured Altererythrobacter sp.]